MRPMVMTALMALLGLLPMAVSGGVGAETARPFAVVIIGGLITGTVLTLFILPLLYPLFESGEIGRCSPSTLESNNAFIREILPLERRRQKREGSIT